MKIGDWVFFKTRNWPKGVQYTRIDPASGKRTDITGQGFYSGRGKVIGTAGGNITVREEKSNRVVEVGPHPDDVIRPLGVKYATLTLGDLRAFLERYKDAPDTVPVSIALPLAFVSDENDLPPDHPEYKAVSAFESVDASSIAFMAFSASGEMTEGYIPTGKRGGEEWDFCVEMMPHDEQCYEAMHRGEDQ